MPKKIMDSEKVPTKRSKSVSAIVPIGRVATQDVKQYLQDTAFQLRLIHRLEDIALNSKDESNAIKALNSLLDRSLGKPETVHQINSHHDQTVVVIRDTGLEPLDITAEVERLANDKPIEVKPEKVDIEQLAIDAIADDLLSDVFTEEEKNELLG